MEVNSRTFFSTKPFFFIIIFFALFIQTSICYSLELQNFDQPTGINSLGGPSDTWTKNDAEINL